MNKKQQRQQKMLRQQEIVNAAKIAGRDLTAEEQAEFDSLQREIETLNGEIEAEEQAQRSANPANVPPSAQQTPANPAADTQRAVSEERQRIREIAGICRDFGMESDAYIQDGSTVDDVRAAALEHIRQHGAPVPARGNAQVTESAEDKFRAAAADALVMRSGMIVILPVTINGVFTTAMRTNDVGGGIVSILPRKRKVSSFKGHSTIDAVFHK